MAKWQVLNGHVIDVLRKLLSRSVNLMFTSPPYWALRDYGLPPLVWGGDPECDHVWGEEWPAANPRQTAQTNTRHSDAAANGQTAKRGQFCQKCGAWLGCLGLEPTLDLFINHLVEIFREARRVLHPSGTLWVDLGDSYAANRGYQVPDSKWGDVGNNHGACIPDGLKPKDLMGVPWRLALALQADGWWLRSDIIWCKGLDRSEQELEAQAEVEEAIRAVRQVAGNSLFGLSKDLDQVLSRAEKAVERLFMVGAAMPESVKDRVTASHEYLFVFSKKRHYYWDKHAIRVQPKLCSLERRMYGRNEEHKYTNGAPGQSPHSFLQKAEIGEGLDNMDVGGRNARTVWRVQTEGHRLFILPSGEEIAHFASFPRALPARAIQAGTSEYGCCEKCGAPFKRIIKPSAAYAELLGRDWADYEQDAKEGRGHAVSNQRTQKRGQAATAEYETVGWEPTCRCFGEPANGLVTCKKCNGTGRQKQSKKRYDDHMPEEGQRESQSRGHIGNVGKNSMELTGEACPKCHGTGQVQGRVWDSEIIKGGESQPPWPIKRPVVLDPFAGTGQTLLAGLDLDCDVIGIDLSEQYCKLSSARCEAWPEALPERGQACEENEAEAGQLGFEDLPIGGLPY